VRQNGSGGAARAPSKPPLAATCPPR
jgi:hypothetical protein